MGFFRRDKASGPAGPTATPAIGSPRDIIDRAHFVFAASVRFEPEDAERRRSPVPPEIYESLAGLKAGLMTDGGEWVVPWHHATKHVAVRRELATLYFSVFDGVITPTTASNQDPNSQVPLRSVPGVTFFENRGGVNGLELSPDGRWLATIEWSGSGSLVLFDTTTGQRRHVTGIDGIAGYEVPLWSPDGDWVLINTWPRPTLVRVDDGSWATVPLEAAWLDWWPARGSAMLVVVHGRGNDQGLGSYDLSTGAFVDLGPIAQPDGRGADNARLRMQNPRMSPDGTRLLIGIPHGPDAAYMAKFGTRDRVGFIDVQNLRAEASVSPFVDAGCWIEREHSNWKWVGPPPTIDVGSVIVHASAVGPMSPSKPADVSAEEDWYRDESIVRWTFR